MSSFPQIETLILLSAFPDQGSSFHGTYRKILIATTTLRGSSRSNGQGLADGNAAGIHEGRSNGSGRHLGGAGFPPPIGSGTDHKRPGRGQEAGRDLSARGRRWPQHCRASHGIQLLPPSANHCYPAKSVDRVGRILWTPPRNAVLQASFRSRPP